MNVRICEKKLHVLRKKIRRRNIYAFFENEETIITKKIHSEKWVWFNKNR